ncbi:MAG: response regulator transcription factor [Baekduia sp.]
MRLLIVEDEERLAMLLRRGLEREGFAVDVAYDGEAGLAQAQAGDYAVVVLDRDLPGLHGDDVCAALREGNGGGPRVLMLTAADGVDDRVRGLELGADDYLTKPFAFRELVARARALARRPHTAHPPILRRGGLELDPARRYVTRDGRAVALRPRELALLEELLRADGAPLTVEQLLARVWDANADPFSNPVRQTVLRLRRALGEPTPIETVPGAGYRIA